MERCSTFWSVELFPRLTSQGRKSKDIWSQHGTKSFGGHKRGIIRATRISFGRNITTLLIRVSESWVKMSGIEPVQSHGSTAKGATWIEENNYEDVQGSSSRAIDGEVETNTAIPQRRPKPKQTYSHTHFKVYKRRWLGLGQLVLLNIVVSWDVSRAIMYSERAHTNVL